MKFLQLLGQAALVWLIFVTPAHAGPLGAAIGAIFTAIKGSFVLQALLRVVVSAALSRLAQALGPKPKQVGIKTDGTSSGSQNPANFILGFYATGGVAVCPPMSHGQAGKTPNAYLTYVIELSDVPGATLSGLIINGERTPLGVVADPDYGFPVASGTYVGMAWVKYYDGTQTTADAMLLSKYGAYPRRPWSATMVGANICYAIVTFRYDRVIYSAFPSVRFEMQGHPLYDPRFDGTVGGVGSQRLNNPATWQITNNPIIMIYNIHLGIALPGSDVWGGLMPVGDLPLGSIFAAANACSALVDNGLGGTELRYRAGMEVLANDEPASVCEELLKSCLGAVADVGGYWRFQAGDSALPIFFFTDDDILVSLDREKQPFQGLDETHNGITSNYPDPIVQWEINAAPPIYNSTWEAEDGGRRLIVNVDFPAVPYPAQVQRNMRALIADNRRFLTHGLPLPPEATVLEPLDTISWSSGLNAYSAKTFEVVKTTEDLRIGVVQVSIRERDPSDTVAPSGYYTAAGTPSLVPVIVNAQNVNAFNAAGVIIADAAGDPRRPAILLTWDGVDQDGIRGIEYEVRRTGTTDLVSKGNTTDIEAAQIPVSDGILPSTNYQARARLMSDRKTNWTLWKAVLTTATPPVTRPDVEDGAVSDQLTAASLPLLVQLSNTVTQFLIVSTGAIAPHQLWRCGVSFEARVTVANDVLALEWRRKYAGVWNAWQQKASDTVGTVLDSYGLTFSFSGIYEDTEFRLINRASGSIGNLEISNMRLTASNLVK